MPQPIGAASGATGQSNQVGSFPRSVAGDARAITDARAGLERPTSGAAPLDVDHAADQAAATRALASCGLHRDDAVWVTECAWCNRVRTVAGDWQTLAPAVRAAMDIQRTHGVCPRCARGLMARAQSDALEAR